jgi:hypothetical protein
MSQTPQPQSKPEGGEKRPEEMVGVIPRIDSWPWGRPQEKCIEAIVLHPLEKTNIERVVLVNAMVLPKRPMIVVTLPTNPENVKRVVSKAKRVESYIGHESTAKLLSDILGINVAVNRGEYVPEKGDIAVVVRLRKRLERPGDIKDVKLEDLEFHIVSYDEVLVQEQEPTLVIYTFPLTL